MILGTICCRGGSKGVPGKNIRPLLGKPLIVYTIEVAQQSKLLNHLMISTDSERIAEIGRKEGVDVPFLRPAYLASDTANKWDVFRHAVEEYEKKANVEVTHLVDMDVTVPLKNVDDIDGAIQFALDNPNTDVVITGYEPERNPYFNMMEVKEDGYVEIVKKSKKPIVRRQDAPLIYSLTPAAYVLKKEALYQFTHWSQAKCKIFEIDRHRAIDIDTEFDFNFVEFIMNSKK